MDSVVVSKEYEFFIIDDPVVERSGVRHDEIRQQLWDWYASTIEARGMSSVTTVDLPTDFLVEVAGE